MSTFLITDHQPRKANIQDPQWLHPENHNAPFAFNVLNTVLTSNHHGFVLQNKLPLLLFRCHSVTIDKCASAQIVSSSYFRFMSNLNNYIRAHRRRLGLRQGDVAAIMGHTISNVCRHERRLCEPSLRTAIRFAIVLQVSIEDLFPGIIEAESQETKKKIALLLPHFKRENSPADSCQQLEALQMIQESLSKVN